MTKESLKWKVRFNTVDGMFSFVNISRKINPIPIEEVQEWAEFRVESEELYSSIDSIEAL
tara:strand:- start:9524 stop:9703 length:180 start_codon:yes stop_codon:yes gene_type:complete